MMRSAASCINAPIFDPSIMPSFGCTYTNVSGVGAHSAEKEDSFGK